MQGPGLQSTLALSIGWKFESFEFFTFSSGENRISAPVWIM